MTPTTNPRACHTSGLSRNRCRRGDWAVAANCTTRNSKAKTTLVSASRPAVMPAIRVTVSSLGIRGRTSTAGTSRPRATPTKTYRNWTSPARSERRRRSARTNGRLRCSSMICMWTLLTAMGQPEVDQGSGGSARECAQASRPGPDGPRKSPTGGLLVRKGSQLARCDSRNPKRTGLRACRTVRALT